RIMGIAAQRYQGHYLTERLLSNLMLAPETAVQVVGSEQRNLRAIEEVTAIKLTLGETGDAVRLEGLDGVGREVARRALRRLREEAAGGRGGGSDRLRQGHPAATRSRDHRAR